MTPSSCSAGNDIVICAHSKQWPQRSRMSGGLTVPQLRFEILGINGASASWVAPNESR